MLPDVAVVIITRDRPEDLFRTLDHLTALPERPTVTVVDNASESDYLTDLCRRFPSVQVVALPANLGAAARTVGVRAAATPFVAFADDDSWWHPGSLSRAAEHMQRQPAVGLIAARVVVEPSGDDDPTSQAMAAGALGPDLRPASGPLRAVTGCMACGCVVRARAYLSVGGFAAGMGVGGEEQLLVWDLWAAGWQAVYDPGVVAHHQPASSRNPAGRRRTVTRNDLWTAWARLPFPTAAARTASVLRSGAGQRRATLQGVGDAVRRADWALARRTTLPDAFEAARRAIER